VSIQFTAADDGSNHGQCSVIVLSVRSCKAMKPFVRQYTHSFCFHRILIKLVEMNLTSGPKIGEYYKEPPLILYQLSRMAICQFVNLPR